MMNDGRAAEKLATKFLERQGFKILGRNWRTKYCEIDIIASKAKRVHFVEVKGRSDPAHGYGYEYITNDKVRRLKRAARFWAAENSYSSDYQIDIISVDGSNREITYIENALQ